jgi:hydrogenase-4 membrane subunit HyfE
MNDSLRHAWQSSGADAALPALAEVRAGADRFYRVIRRRNRIEYGACVLVVLFFGLAVFKVSNPFAAAGAALIVLGTLLVAWQLHSRASAEAPPAADAGVPILAHQRAQLVRQRDALARIALWYLGPLVPGLALFLLAPVLRHGLGALNTGLAIALAVNVLMLGGVWWLNRLAARQLQRAIDDLDALAGEQ